MPFSSSLPSLPSRRARVRALGVAAAVCAVALPACGASGPSSASASASTGSAATAAAPAATTAAGSAPGPDTTAGATPAASTHAPTAPASSAPAASCGAAFTTAGKSRAAAAGAPLVGVRAGRHTCFDRLVLEFSGRVTGYRVQYVTRVTVDGSGATVPLAGAARLQLTVQAPAYDAAGHATFAPADRAHVAGVTGFAAFRQVAWAGSFEGSTSLGVGVRQELPFRVLVLAGPGGHTRLVLDVAHSA
ncbi:MAG TPA: hypothetical protein VE781_06885 [Kineosporiaceae bacterium]|nr:hypothetical protein [Kineosporiaceae bacterium]